jgi:hypothetical protein
MKKSKTFSMAAQLKKGKKAEKDFLEQYGAGAIERLDGRKGDLRIKWSRAVIELKTDFYSKSTNLFMERWSVVATPDRPEGKPGGPWQSLTHDAAYYVYWFAETGELFVFDTKVLVSYLEENVKSFRPCPVRNNGYTTLGYIVPKEKLLKFHTEHPDKKLLVELTDILHFTVEEKV